MTKGRNPDPEIDRFQRIAGAFVHEFNNLFQTALGNLDLLSGRIRDPSHTELLNETIISVERAVELTERLNLIGNKDPRRFQRFDVHGGIATAVAGLRERLGTQRKITVHGDGTGLYCRLPPGQMEKLLSTLIFNGPAALSRGTLTVETAACALAENTEELPSGAYARITIFAGDADAAAPTTRDMGTGLLLARMFAAQLGGACRMEQARDGSARVDLFLPADDADIAGTGPPAPSRPAPTTRS